MPNPYHLPARLLKRCEQLARLPDNNSKFERIIELGKKLKAYPEEFRTEDYRVQGCTSLTYIQGELREGRMYYSGDSNSSLVKGLVALVLEAIEGLSPREIADIDPSFLDMMSISEALSASRANGFANTLNAIRKYSLLALERT